MLILTQTQTQTHINSFNEYSEKIEDIIDDSSLDIDDVVKKIETIDNKIKFKAFGKVKV